MVLRNFGSSHHFDLLSTPFGADLHGHICLQYLAFQRWSNLLTTWQPDLFDAPLADWLASEPLGSEDEGRLMSSGPLGQALLELRGSVLFDEVMRGAPPRRVEPGWGDEAGLHPTLKLVGGLEYKRVTVNKLWATVSRGPSLYYLGPREILEGRAFALNMLLLWSISGQDAAEAGRAGRRLPGTEVDIFDLLSRYVDTFYRDATRYLTALEIVSGATFADLISSRDKERLRSALANTVIITWYALHAPRSAPT